MYRDWLDHVDTTPEKAREALENNLLIKVAHGNLELNFDKNLLRLIFEVCFVAPKHLLHLSDVLQLSWIFATGAVLGEVAVQ